MMALRRDMHSLAGPYALDALHTTAELERFERHLARCQDCTGEVRGFRETATRLGMAATRQPPPELRERVMAAVARTRQVPATEDHARHARPVHRMRVLPRLAMGAGAVGVAAAVVLSVLLVNTQNQLSQTRRQLNAAQTQLAAITAVRTAADARLLTKVTKLGGTVSVVSSPSKHEIVVTTSGLPPPPAGKVYQLWLIGAKPNVIRSEGLLSTPRGGHTGPVLISGVLAGDLFGLTVEPAGGSIQPTLSTLAVTVPAS